MVVGMNLDFLVLFIKSLGIGLLHTPRRHHLPCALGQQRPLELFIMMALWGHLRAWLPMVHTPVVSSCLCSLHCDFLSLSRP